MLSSDRKWPELSFGLDRRKANSSNLIEWCSDIWAIPIQFIISTLIKWEAHSDAREWKAKTNPFIDQSKLNTISKTMTKLMKTWNSPKNTKKCRSMRASLDQDNITVLAVLDISNPQKPFKCTSQLENIKECSKRCWRSLILMKKLMKQESD